MLADELAAVVDPAGLLAGEDIGERYVQDVMGISMGRPQAVLRPADSDQVSRALAICNRAGVGVVTQGGMTGLVQGGIPLDGEVVLSLERMNAIEEVDSQSGTMTVQAGCVLQTIQERAEAEGYSFPLDLGGRGSCTIGGNISTNAGGNRVIRYGMTRDLVLGLEAVLADGTVLSNLNKVIKNNTGYDLKHLFIGAEGTLGVVTRAVLRLHPQQSSQSVALCSLPSFAAVVDFLRLMREQLGGALSAYELLWRSYMELVAEASPGIEFPFPLSQDYFVLLESQGSDPAADRQALEDALALAHERGLLVEAVVAKSQAEVAKLWQIRDLALEAVQLMMPAAIFDVSIPISRMEDFVAAIEQRLGEIWPDHRLVVLGHIGDSNLHVLVKPGEVQRGGPNITPYDVIYELTGERQGSISAEHGIGFQKRPYLKLSRSPAELEMMRKLKALFDPNNILNPGRIFGED